MRKRLMAPAGDHSWTQVQDEAGTASPGNTFFRLLESGYRTKSLRIVRRFDSRQRTGMNAHFFRAAVACALAVGSFGAARNQW